MENLEHAPNHTRQGSAPVSKKAVGLALCLHNFVARMAVRCTVSEWMKMARVIPFRRNDDNTASAENG